MSNHPQLTGETRARFHFYRVKDHLVAVIDLDIGTSVTNDAEAVVCWLRKNNHLMPTDRLIYRDTEGHWDEIVLNAGEFRGFRAIAPRTRELGAAVKWVEDHI